VYPADDASGRRRVIERSLGVIDKHEAWQVAADQIKAHKAFMLERRQARAARIVHGPWVPEYQSGLPPGPHTLWDGRTFTVLESGLYALPDGRAFIAGDRQLTFTDGTTRQNGGPGIYLTGAQLSPRDEINALADAWDSKIDAGPVQPARRVLATVKADADKDLLEDYIKFGSIKKNNGRDGKPLSPVRAKEARRIWSTFKQVVDKPLKDCGYDDAVKLVAHIEAEHEIKHGEPIKAATIRRTLVPLVALVTRAQVLKTFTGTNPFLHVGSNGAASDIVDEFSDADMALIRKHLDKLDTTDQLLLRLAASTGMDRKELFSIQSEATEGGIRYCTIAKGKTDSRARRIPFPTALVKHKNFPETITKPLFTGRPDTRSKRLTEFMVSIGIVMDRGIGEEGQRHVLHPLHSFRHRARSRLLKAYPAGDELAYAVGGWTNGTKKNAGWNYGKFPLRTLREAIDKIGGL
jgi:integrase